MNLPKAIRDYALDSSLADGDMLPVAKASPIATRRTTMAKVRDYLAAYFPALLGKAGGSAIAGGTGPSENLELDSTTDPTKGSILFGSASAYKESTQSLGIGTTGPAADVDVTKSSNGSVSVLVNNTNNGSSASGGVDMRSDTARLFAIAQSSTKSTSRYGQTLSNWTEIVELAGAGLAIGTNTLNVPILIGQNSAIRQYFDTSGNILLFGLTSAGTSAAGVLGIKNGTAPTTSPANCVQLWSAAAAAGDAHLFARSENGKSERITGTRQRVATQFDATTTTLGNVTGLTHNVLAGKSYAFRAVLRYSANATGGHKYAIAGTATATAVTYRIKAFSLATAAYVIGAEQTALAGASGQAGSTAGETEITGLITVNAAGTLTVQFAQNAASGTSSVLVGSWFELLPIGD